jgi:hypothetical protein
MTEVICLDDSDDDVDAPAAASRPNPRAAVHPPVRPPVRSDDVAHFARGAQPSAISDDGFGTSSSSDEGIFTDRTANRRAAKKRRVAAVPPRDASAGPPRTARSRAASGFVPDGERSPSARQARAASNIKNAAAAAARAEKNRAAEETRSNRAVTKELVRQTKEREKVAKANAKHRAAVAGGKYKLRQITTIVSSDLARDDFGRALADAFEMGVVDDANGRAVVPLFHTTAAVGSETTPLPKSVTWRYHAPADAPVGADERRERDAGTHEREPTNDGSDGAVSGVSAEYTLVYFTGAAFVAACAADHAAGVHARSRGVRGDDGGPPELFPDELPERGLERLLATARKKLPGHTLGLLLEGVKRECAARERREFRVDPGGRFARPSPFSRAVVEDAVARLHASDRGVRVTCVPDLGAATRHAVGVAAALAKRPFEREVSALDVLAHAKRRGVTPAAALALEAAAAGGSDREADGAARDGENGNGDRRGSRAKTCAETWCAALMTIDGCAESSALAIVRAYPTMCSLMREYARTDLTERAKKELLQNLTRAVTSETQSRDRRVGPVVSARVHSVLRPRGAEDAGDEIVGVGA